MSLFLDVGPDDLLQIGDSFITVEHKSGKRARLKITGKAPARLIKGGLRAAPAVPSRELSDIEIGAVAGKGGR